MRAILIAAALAACQSARESKGGAGAPAGQPTDAVGAFFAAVDAGSCPRIEAVVGGTLGQQIASAGCEQALAEYRRHRLHLVGVHDAAVDGRDPDAYLVHVTVSRDGKDDDIQVRVESSGGAWRMTTL